MKTNLFDQAKSISAQQAAERYADMNITNARKNYHCPFPDHQDRGASFRFYDGGTFYCFGCNRGGTSIDFTAALFNLTNREAAEMLCRDFNLQVDNADQVRTGEPARASRKQIEQAFAWLDNQTMRYIRWCNHALANLSEDSEQADAERAIFLREREKAQRLADALLEASQDLDEKRKEQLLIANVKWAKDKAETLDAFASAGCKECESYE